METLTINADGGTLSGLLAAIVDALFFGRRRLARIRLHTTLNWKDERPVSPSTRSNVATEANVRSRALVDVFVPRLFSPQAIQLEV